MNSAGIYVNVKLHDGRAGKMLSSGAHHPTLPALPRTAARPPASVCAVRFSCVSDVFVFHHCSVVVAGHGYVRVALNDGKVLNVRAAEIIDGAILTKALEKAQGSSKPVVVPSSANLIVTAS